MTKVKFAFIKETSVRNVWYAEPEEANNWEDIKDFVKQCPDEVMTGWTYDGINWHPPIPYVKKDFTEIEFKQLFLLEERILFETLIKNDILFKIKTEDFFAGKINIDNQETKDFMKSLVNNNILTQERADTFFGI